MYQYRLKMRNIVGIFAIFIVISLSLEIFEKFLTRVSLRNIII